MLENGVLDTSTQLIVAALVLGLFVILFEGAIHLPIRLPGHRAFPGALALLVAAEAFAPLLLAVFASVIPAYLVISGQYGPWTLLVWATTALLAWRLGKTAIAQKFVYFLLCGLAFGLFSYLSKFAGFHKTPELLRVGGHLAFGALGGIASFGISRWMGQSSEK